MIKSHDPNHNLRHQNNPLDVKIPTMKSRAGSHSFSLKGSTLWNEVSTDLRAIEQKQHFKRAMKKTSPQIVGYNKAPWSV